VEGTNNLSQSPSDTAWIYEDAKAYDDAYVCDGAQLRDLSEAKDNAWIGGGARMASCAIALASAVVSGRFTAGGDMVIAGQATRSPLFLQPAEGLTCTILDSTMQINCQHHALGTWAQFSDRDFLRMEGRVGLKNARLYLPTFLQLARNDGRDFGFLSLPAELSEPTHQGWQRSRPFTLA
jgi:hypothetical protein